LEILISGNVPKNCPKPRTNPTGSGSGSIPPADPLEDSKSFFEQHQKEILIGLALLGIIFYLYSQKDAEEDEDAKESKKFMRQMMLMNRKDNEA